MTPAEVKDLVERWQAVSQIAQGHPQRVVKEKLGISISKVSHAAKVLQYGTGGFKQAIKRLKKP